MEVDPLLADLDHLSCGRETERSICKLKNAIAYCPCTPPRQELGVIVTGFGAHFFVLKGLCHKTDLVYFFSKMYSRTDSVFLICTMLIFSD